MGRDPIAEKGGLHLYAFTLNNPINRWDLLGMETEGETREYMGRTYAWHDDGSEGPGWYLQTYLWGDGEGVNEFFSSIGFDPSGGAATASTYQWSRSGSTISGNSYSGSVVKIVTGDSQMRDALSGFFSGTREVNRVFGPNEPWTRDMQNHPHVQGVTAQISALLATDAQSLLGKPIAANFDLNNQSLATNISTYVRDGLAGIGLTGAQYSTGSFRLTYTVTGISDGVATVTFQINDALSFGSFTRLPTTNLSVVNLIGAGALADQGGGGSDVHLNLLTAPASSVNNPMGPNAPFNTVNLQWNWTQQIAILPPSTDGPGPGP